METRKTQTPFSAPHTFGAWINQNLHTVFPPAPRVYYFRRPTRTPIQSPQSTPLHVPEPHAVPLALPPSTQIAFLAGGAVGIGSIFAGWWWLSTRGLWDRWFSEMAIWFSAHVVQMAVPTLQGIYIGVSLISIAISYAAALCARNIYLHDFQLPLEAPVPYIEAPTLRDHLAIFWKGLVVTWGAFWFSPFYAFVIVHITVDIVFNGMMALVPAAGHYGVSKTLYGIWAGIDGILSACGLPAAADSATYTQQVYPTPPPPPVASNLGWKNRLYALFGHRDKPASDSETISDADHSPRGCFT